MSRLDFTVLKKAKRNRVLVILLILIVALPLFFFALVAPVKTGTKTNCTYDHLIKDDTKTVLVWRWTAGSHEVTTKINTCSKHRKLEALYRRAREATDKKDYKRAKEILAEIKKADPNFQPGNVAMIEAEINSGSAAGGSTTPGDTSGTTPGGTTPDGTTPEYSGDLAGLFPASLAGYTLINDSPGQLSASRMYAADAAAHPNVAYLTIQFSRAGSEASITNYIDRYVKTYYAANAKSFQIRSKDAYFGTDAASLAILAYSAKGVIVELEMSALDGNGADLYDTLVDLSTTVP